MNENLIKVQIATTRIEASDAEKSSTSSAGIQLPRQGSVKLAQIVKQSGNVTSLHGTLNFAASRREESLQKLENILNE